MGSVDKMYINWGKSLAESQSKRIEELEAKCINKEYYRKKALENKEQNTLLTQQLKEKEKQGGRWYDKFQTQKLITSELKERVKELEKIIKEAINLPKGIEPHSYSDYKTNKTK